MERMQLRDAKHGEAYLRTWGLPEEPDATTTSCWCGCDKDIEVGEAVWVPVTWAQPDDYKGWLDVPVPFAAGCVEVFS